MNPIEQTKAINLIYHIGREDCVRSRWINKGAIKAQLVEAGLPIPDDSDNIINEFWYAGFNYEKSLQSTGDGLKL